MQSRISLKWLLFVIGVVEMALSSVIIFFMIPDVVEQFSYYTEPISFTRKHFPQSAVNSGQAELVPDIVVPEQALAPRQQVSSSLPLRLKITSLRVDASIEYVGLTSEGAMGVPKGPAEVAWFSLGPRPGDKGSAVIDGHSGWKDGEPAVFDDLHKLQIGDKIYVEDSNGGTVTFIVRKSRLYDPNADASDVFISSDGKSHLNLITCEGVWDTVTKSRSKRLVVFTDKEIIQ